MSLPPADLRCPDPPRCPVLAGLQPRGLRTCVVPTTRVLWRSYDGNGGWAEPNPGFGDSRFAPFDDASGRRVPVMYLAATDTAALLETTFHNLDHSAGDRLVLESELLGRMLAEVTAPRPLRLLDLRDARLDALGVSRGQLVSSPAEHYPCTRRLALAAHGEMLRGSAVDGILWHSRQAELAASVRGAGLTPRLSAVEVMVVFSDRVVSGRGTWPLHAPGLRRLFDGPGRLRVDEIAEDLGATIMPSS